MNKTEEVSGPYMACRRGRCLSLRCRVVLPDTRREMGDLERLGLLSTRLVVRIFGCNSSAEERGDYRKCWLHPPSDVKVNMCMSLMGRESLYVSVVKMVAYARIEQGYYVPQPGENSQGACYGLYPRAGRFGSV